MKKYLFFLPILATLFYLSCEDEGKEDPEPILPVTACFTVSDNIFVGEPAVFNADCSENASSYIWVINDIAKTGKQVTHSFDEPGEYLVVLQAEGANDEDEITKTVTVHGEKISYLSGTITSTRGLFKDSLYIVAGVLKIETGGILSIEPGTIVKFQPDGLIDCHGIVFAGGTSELPIIFTSIKDDTHGGDSNKDGGNTSPEPGDWSYFHVEHNNNGSFFEYCKFLYGGKDPDASYSLNIASPGSTISKCTFAHNKSQELGALNLKDSKGGNIVNSNIFYNNIVPMSINGRDDYDDSNIFHNPSDPSVGNTKNGIFFSYVYDNTITGHRSWAVTEVPFVIKDNLDFDIGRSLTLSPGVVLKLDAERRIILRGGIMKAIGTSDSPIVFTSYLDDAAGGDTNGDGTLTSPSAGDWDFLEVRGYNNNLTELIYCSFQYGGNNEDFDYTVGIYSDLTKIDNCTFKDNVGAEKGALNVENAMNGTIITNNVFYNNIIPLGIGLSVNIDNSNVFHNPDSPEIINKKNGIFVGDVSKETTGEITWAETEVPFVITGTYNVYIEGSNTLTISDDVIIKFGSGRRINFDVNNLFIGDNVWFTSYFDDSYGGDTNGDGSVTSPSNGDWDGIYNLTSSEYEIWDNILFDGH